MGPEMQHGDSSPAGFDSNSNYGSRVTGLLIRFISETNFTMAFCMEMEKRRKCESYLKTVVETALHQ